MTGYWLSLAALAAGNFFFFGWGLFEGRCLFGAGDAPIAGPTISGRASHNTLNEDYIYILRTLNKRERL